MEKRLRTTGLGCDTVRSVGAQSQYYIWQSMAPHTTEKCRHSAHFPIFRI